MNTYCFRVAVTQIRFNVLPINNNIHRFSDKRQDKLCPFCKSKIENEVHFLLKCGMYTDLREKFLSEYIDKPLNNLLRANNADCSRNLSRYIFHSVNRRKKLVT